MFNPNPTIHPMGLGQPWEGPHLTSTTKSKGAGAGGEVAPTDSSRLLLMADACIWGLGMRYSAGAGTDF